MVKVRKDLTGQRFGLLTVLYQAEDYIVPSSGKHTAMWVCECDCGNIITVQQGAFTRKHPTRSCGCLQRQMSSERKKNNRQQNLHYLGDDYGILLASNANEVIFFDLEDADKILQYYWGVLNDYATTCIDNRVVKMHQLIGCSFHDHNNRNKLDNRRNNLLPCTQSENALNRSLPSSNTSGVIGVDFHKSENKWRARIMIDGKRKELGQFINKDDAIFARLKAEKELCGDFAPQKHLFHLYGIE